jgi:glycosyltransferase involved in cell wall biosynthesis
MARVAFFTERIDDSIGSFAFEMMTGLADQQHDLRVYSTYREDDSLPETHSRLQLIRPFKKWNWLELGMLVPLLMEQQPEILHFIQPHEEALRGFTNAMAAIPLLAPLIQKPSVVLSLYDFKERELDQFRTLLMTADVITVTNESQSGAVEKWLARVSSKSKRHAVSIVPLPSSSLKLDAGADLPENIQKFAATGKLLLVPGEVSNHDSVEDLFSLIKEVLVTTPETRALFIGGWGDIKPLQRRDLMKNFSDSEIGARVLFTGALSQSGQHQCLARAHIVLAASLSLESVALARWTRSSLSASVPLILSRKQLELDPLPWRHQVTAFIVDGGPFEWGATLTESLNDGVANRKVRANLAEFARLETFDMPSNVMSRIYAQLAAKSSR